MKPKMIEIVNGLSEDQRANVFVAMVNPVLQQNIIKAMFDCQQRGDTGVSDIWEYIEEDDYPISVRNALFGNKVPVDVQDDEEEEADQDPNAICYSIDAQQLLIDNVKQIVLDSFNGSE